MTENMRKHAFLMPMMRFVPLDASLCALWWADCFNLPVMHPLMAQCVGLGIHWYRLLRHGRKACFLVLVCGGLIATISLSCTHPWRNAWAKAFSGAGGWGIDGKHEKACFSRADDAHCTLGCIYNGCPLFCPPDCTLSRLPEGFKKISRQAVRAWCHWMNSFALFS